MNANHFIHKEKKCFSTHHHNISEDKKRKLDCLRLPVKHTQTYIHINPCRSLNLHRQRIPYNI